MLRPRNRTASPTPDDPFALVLAPPPNETPEERAIREAKEQEALRVSNAIDETIKAEKAAERKKKVVRLLLLGQSESGKSTTLRQFQLHYTPHAFQKEKLLWRAVIQLNLVRSILTVLDALSDAQAESLARQQRIQAQHQAAISMSMALERAREDSVGPGQFAYSLMGTDSGGAFLENGGQFGDGYSGMGLSPAEMAGMPVAGDMPLPAGDDESDDPLFFGEDFEILKGRLEPLRHVEEILIAKLAPHDEDGTGPMRPTRRNGAGPGPSAGTGRNRLGGRGRGSNEVTIRSAVMARLKGLSGKDADEAGMNGHDREWDEPTEVIYGCREEMMALWEDSTVREVLKRRKVRVEEGPGFFLDDLARISTLDYTPSDDDVLRARLKTVGVSEYRFDMESTAGRESGSEWRIYDVGGSRSQRQTWVPYFDDIDAIIFLAPISAFDQALVEDHSVNRLEDSVLLWKSICSNKLLANVDLILFLNKCDILAAKLEAGVRLSKYVRSFGDRSNDVETASAYFKSKFQAIQREYSPQPRRFYGYATSVTDRETTKGILSSVRDMIVREHLRKSRLI